MARGIYGAGLQGISGSINSNDGGWTFSKDGKIRRRVVGTNPNSTNQQNVRTGFSFLTSAWATLTEPQRLAWETARGESYYLTSDSLHGVSRPYSSSKDLFVAMNANYLTASGEIASPSVIFSAPGAASGQDEITAVSVAIDASAQTVALTYTGTFTNEKAYFKATPPVSAGNMKASTVDTRSRVIDEDLGSSPVAMGTSYTSRFGAITGAAGKKVFWELWGVDQGTGKARQIAAGSTVIVA
jgi:hypothetical protein